MNAAAVKAKRHHMWLEKIGTAQRNYVMINQQDKVLLFAGFLFDRTCSDGNCEGQVPPTSRTTYVEYERTSSVSITGTSCQPLKITKQVCAPSSPRLWSAMT